MTSHLKLVTSRVAAQATDLVPDSPNVMDRQFPGLAIAVPSACDRGQMRFTGADALAALTECWNALAMQTLQANQDLACSFIRSFWFPGASSVRPSADRAALRPGGAVMRAHEGIAPLYRRAAANAGRVGAQGSNERARPVHRAIGTGKAMQVAHLRGEIKCH
jgi:D-serine deaminase-like pyridoxal phosphate-dependent protein